MSATLKVCKDVGLGPHRVSHLIQFTQLAGFRRAAAGSCPLSQAVAPVVAAVPMWHLCC